MGGPIGAGVQLNTEGAGGRLWHPYLRCRGRSRTGHRRVLRYTAVQDVGRAIHPSYVEGQIQGGVAQGIGWALNEEYIYNKDGKLDNPGFLDYRMPVASDLPMLDTVMVEVPNPRHPHGVSGVGEVPLVPVMAAVANAVHDATGVRIATCRCRRRSCAPPSTRRSRHDWRQSSRVPLTRRFRFAGCGRFELLMPEVRLSLPHRERGLG